MSEELHVKKKQLSGNGCIFDFVEDRLHLGNTKKNKFSFGISLDLHYLCIGNEKDTIMSYTEMAQLELFNALNNINSEAELNEFKNLLAHYFAQKAQKAIDKMWDEGVINEQTIEEWGKEHMRTPYGYETHRS